MPDALIDNQQHRLADAIKSVAPHANQARFAVGYFFVSGFNAIADSIQHLGRLQILIGATTNRQTVEQLALGYRRRELVEEKLRQQRFASVETAMTETAGDIRRQLSELQPGEREERTVRTLAGMIEAGKVEVRIFTRGVLHAKAYIFDYATPQPNSRGIGIVGSSNLSEAGLSSNTELNVQVDDDANIITGEGLHRDLCEWFDKLWAEAKPFSEALLQELNESWVLSIARPYDVYLKLLFEMVRSRLEDDSSRLVLPDEIPLAAYQKVAVQQAIGMVKAYRGAFVADVVGVGKSFVGSAVARHFYESERRRPLIVCPKPLQEMWEGYNRKWHLNAEILPLSMIKESKGDGDGVVTGLDGDKYQDCGFILVDESHNLRYSDSDRFRILSQYLADGADRKVLLMTATPYNKTNWDVFNQIKLFHPEESTRIPVEPRNLREYFRRVDKGERRLQDLLVHLLVRRTRWQLLRWYGYDEGTDRPVDPKDFDPYLHEERRAYLKFTTVEGIEERRFFPYRRLRTVEYCVDDVYGQEHGHQLYSEIVKMLQRSKSTNPQLRLIPEDEADTRADDPRALTYGRYGLYNYVFPERRRDQRYRRLVRAGKNLRGLIRTSLFKRLESSVEAFRQSIDRQIVVHTNFLHALDNGKIAAGEEAAKLLEGRYDETDDSLAAFLEDLREAEEERGFAYDIKDFRAADLRRDIAHDLETFKYIQSLVTREKVPPARDAKLQKFLLDLLPGLMKNGKLLVFTQYEDTARYIWDNLPQRLKERAHLVTGDTENLQGIVKHFAPQANPDINAGATRLKPLDLLIATDVLAEGLNLQDCNQVLNFDLHWNPVRLIQRFGRIDRIGSQHDEIFAVNFLPEKAAEKELGLREKLERRIKEFNDILGLDSQVLDEKERINTEAVYAIYEETSGRHLGRFEGDDTLIGATLADAEEFFRDLRERNPEEYQRIRDLRDGIRTARKTGDGKVLVLGRAGDFLRLYVRDLRDQPVDIDTTTAIGLAACKPEDDPSDLPTNLNQLLVSVKLILQKDVDDLWAQRKTRSNLSAGQRYILEQLEKLKKQRPMLDADGGIARLVEAVSRTRQKRFQLGCDRLRKNKVIAEILLRRVRQLYYDCGLHLERLAAEEEEIEQRIPRIVAVCALP